MREYNEEGEEWQLIAKMGRGLLWFRNFFLKNLSRELIEMNEFF